MVNALFALATNSVHAEKIVNKLMSNGLSTDEISLLIADFERRFQEQSYSSIETSFEGELTDDSLPVHDIPRAGIGTLAVPGIGILIATGPLLKMLTTTPVGRASGLVTTVLANMGISEHEAKKYEDAVRKGAALICIHLTDGKKGELLKQILQKEKAQNIAMALEKASSAY